MHKLMEHRIQALLVTVIGLLVLFGTRLYQLTALPLFLDESIIIEWALDIRSGSPLGFGYHGKYLLPWVTSIFLPETGADWVLRVVTLLFVMLGAASLVRLGRHLDSWGLGLAVLFALIWTPMLFFFDRLALTDTVLHAMLSVFLLCIFLAYDRHKPDFKLAILVSMSFVLSLLAKSTALVLLPLPTVALIFLPRTWPIKQRLLSGTVTYMTIALIWLPLQLVLMWRGMNYFGLADQYSTGLESSATLTEKFLTSVPVIFFDTLHYFTAPLLVVFLVSSVVICWRSRRGFVILAMIGGFVLALVIAAIPGIVASRYWLGAVPAMMLVIVWGLYLLPYRRISLTILGIYLVTLIAPLMHVAYSSPQELSLPHADRLSYIEMDSAGTGLPEIAQLLDERQQPVIGAVAQCFTLSLYTETAVECFNVVADNDRAMRLQSLAGTMGDSFLLVLEEPGFIGLDDLPQIEADLISEVVRPGGRTRIMVYDVHLLSP